MAFLRVGYYNRGYDKLIRNDTQMTDTEMMIKEIVVEEFSLLMANIESDFKKNYIQKQYNFLISQMDSTLTANMVFVSSFESKSGNAMEACAKRIARLKFGVENVPPIVNPRGVPHDMDPSKVIGQIIVTDIDVASGDLHGEIDRFRANREAVGRGKSRRQSTVTQSSIKELLAISEKYRTRGYHTKPVDLAFFDNGEWNILELKAGGDLDTSNAPSNVDKLLTIYAGVHVENAKAYFVALYNKNGEGHTWKSTVKKHLAYPEMFLIGKQFWDKILPDGISFKRFTKIYKAALEEIDLNARMVEIINRTIENRQ